MPADVDNAVNVILVEPAVAAQVERGAATMSLRRAEFPRRQGATA